MFPRHLRRFRALCCFLIVAFALRSPAKIITVNTTNLVASAGETNLSLAISLLADGDSIHFAIPGTGPFYLITPPLAPDNGYPAITNHNVTIDGCTQPGALVNTNTILGSNTAQIQIVLDSRDGGAHSERTDGYGDGEASVLFIKGSTNVTLRGLCFLGPGIGSGTPNDPATYAVSFALGSTNGHVNGCWFGVAPDRTNVFRFQAAVTSFQGSGESFGNGIVIGAEQNAPDVATARSQFNVIVGEYIPIILEGRDQRIAGNFFNVLPDGVTDFNCDGNGDHTLQAFIEIGRSGDNLVIGTDGDGNNDAEERNIFGGATAVDDFNLLEWYGSSSKNTVIAGNYFGVGVDGVTRFTNSMTMLGGLHSSTTLRFGTDCDGVSDDLECNVISMNTPFSDLFPSPPNDPFPRFTIGTESGACISFRGNAQLGAQLAPFTYANGFGDYLNAFTNYYAAYASGALIPEINSNSTRNFLRSSCAAGVAPFTNIVIDVYLADNEAWANGAAFQFSELNFTNGFAAGKTWLASFTDDGPFDLNPEPGEFAFDISELNIPAETLVTFTASYRTNAASLHNTPTHTSVFAMPAVLPIVPQLGIALSGGNLHLFWPTNAGMFNIQSTTNLISSSWSDLNPQPNISIIGTNYNATIPATNQTLFFRLSR